jgi:hypothetical protein
MENDMERMLKELEKKAAAMEAELGPMIKKMEDATKGLSEEEIETMFRDGKGQDLQNMTGGLMLPGGDMMKMMQEMMQTAMGGVQMDIGRELEELDPEMRKKAEEAMRPAQNFGKDTR